ncbi:MAG: GPW/gp25 family protein [Flavobacteriales bacterium]|jgi:phage baseplate assembly protein W|nr:GPW/gp25 family protein [Flavobacteriales bacterium]MBK6752537.1 GPW/gp25 family protein [Flavobacteriales bacterium]MBK7271432.1 GPW/gp25 family protein [Flavobacteriales bacterium]MBK7754191.1 GPW/gp25 family protein [Flavobacteriales bacterium]MBK9074508.1 GPW/gp25 family protein [Flavobacteriales bacterium]
MAHSFFSLPFRPDELLSGREHPRQPNLEQAIAEHLSVILRTTPGASPGNPEYGCRIWHHLAERVRGEAWLAQFKEDVRNAVVKNEPRLTGVEVDIKTTRSDRNDLSLTISANMVPGGRPFRFARTILTDPIRMS